MKISLISSILIFLCFSTGLVSAFCMAPMTTFITTPIKPSTPLCVNRFNNTHTCDGWEINSYNSRLKAYNLDVEFFIKKLNKYIDESVEYAKCRMNQLE